MSWRAVVAVCALPAAVLVAGCQGEPQAPGIANPASTHCLEQGGQLEVRVDVDGSERGICVFPDGSECDEWEFYRGDCAPGTGTP